MNNRALFIFALENLSAQLYKHRGVLILSVLLIFFTSSIIFFSTSLKAEVLNALKSEPDFVVQKVVSWQQIPLNEDIGDEIIEIAGTKELSSRVYGRYTFDNERHNVLVYGIDFLDDQSHKALKKLLKNIDLNSFLSKSNYMIVGNGVAKWLNKNGYNNSLTFISPEGKAIPLNVYATLPKDIELFSNDIVITTIKNARKIFGLKSNEVTDFVFNAPNEIEWEIIKIKVASLDNNLRIIDKKESHKIYEEMFNFTEGFFLLSLMIVTLSFVMILYQRYTQVYSTNMRFIGVLRATGWSIIDVLKLQFIETIFIIIIAFSFGIALAYIYVFILDAPFISSIFLGAWNFEYKPEIKPYIDIFTLSSIFLLYALPFLAVVLFPTWKISTKNPVEALR